MTASGLATGTRRGAWKSPTRRIWRDFYVDTCAIRGKENVEWVEVSEEEAIDLDELEDMFPDDFCGV